MASWEKSLFCLGLVLSITSVAATVDPLGLPTICLQQLDIQGKCPNPIPGYVFVNFPGIRKNSSNPVNESTKLTLNETKTTESEPFPVLPVVVGGIMFGGVFCCITYQVVLKIKEKCRSMRARRRCLVLHSKPQAPGKISSDQCRQGHKSTDSISHVTEVNQGQSGRPSRSRLTANTNNEILEAPEVNNSQRGRGQMKYKGSCELQKPGLKTSSHKRVSSSYFGNNKTDILNNFAVQYHPNPQSREYAEKDGKIPLSSQLQSIPTVSSRLVAKAMRAGNWPTVHRLESVQEEEDENDYGCIDEEKNGKDVVGNKFTNYPIYSHINELSGARRSYKDEQVQQIAGTVTTSKTDVLERDADKTWIPEQNPTDHNALKEIGKEETLVQDETHHDAADEIEVTHL